MKTCTKCAEEKELSEFYYDKHKDGYVSACRPCRNKVTREKYAANKDKYANNHLLRTYQITMDDKIAIRESQHGCCQMCQLEYDVNDLHVDHCHSTGDIRGLLCGACNRALGLLKDNQATLRNTINYLQESQHD